MAARQILIPDAMPSRDPNGRALPAVLRFYQPEAAYSVPKTVYTDSSLTVAHPVSGLESDAAGIFPAVWADEDEIFDAGWYAQAGGRRLNTYTNIRPVRDLRDPGGIAFRFSTTTTDADPGAGALRFDNATLASVTKLYFDNVSDGGETVTTWLDSFDDTAETQKGQIIVQETGGETIVTFRVTGAVVDGTGYRKVDVTHESGAVSFADGTRLTVLFVPAGKSAYDAWRAQPGNEAGSQPDFVAAILNGFATKAVFRINLTGGTANALVGTTDPVVTLQTGQLGILTPSDANTGAVTIALDGGAAIPINNRSGTALSAEQLKPVHYLVRVGGSGASLQLLVLSPLEATDSQAANATDYANYISGRRLAPLLGKAINITLTSSSGDVLAGTTANGLNPTAGQLVEFRPNAVNTTATTIAFNGGSALSILSRDGAALSAGELISGRDYLGVVTNSGPVRLLTPTEATVLRGRRIVDGVVLRNWRKNATTRIVSLSQGRVWNQRDALGGVAGGPTYKVNEVIDQELATNQALIVDLDGSVDGNGRLTPVVGNLAATANKGWQDGNKVVLFSVSNLQSGTDELQMYGGGAYSGDGNRDAAMGDMIVAMSGSTVSVMIPTTPNGYRFTEWRFVRSTSAGINCDVWRMSGAYDATLSVQNTKVRQQILMRTAEVETAIQEDGKAGFVGGVSHGNQLLSSITMWADGAVVSPSATATFKCRKFEAMQVSALYRYGENPDGGGAWTASQKIGDVYTYWRWENGELVLENTLVMSQALTLDYTYLGIFPVYRTANSGAAQDGAAVDIVTSGLRLPRPNGGVEDLSTSGYSEVETTASKMIGWGAGGYKLEIDKLAGWDKPNRASRFSASVDNKFYQNLTGQNYAAASGEVITAKTRYRIDNPY